MSAAIVVICWSSSLFSSLDRSIRFWSPVSSWKTETKKMVCLWNGKTTTTLKQKKIYDNRHTHTPHTNILTTNEKNRKILYLLVVDCRWYSCVCMVVGVIFGGLLCSTWKNNGEETREKYININYMITATIMWYIHVSIILPSIHSLYVCG